MKTTDMTPEMVRALDLVKAGRAEQAPIGSLRALVRRGAIKLDVRTVRYPHRGRTVCEIDVRAEVL